MPVLLYKLNGVPPDEATEIRQLLEDNNILFYETSSGNWGVSLAAIWLSDESCLERAQHILREYQKKRQIRVRGEYLQSVSSKSKLSLLTDNPLRFLLYITFVLLILYFSTIPFWDFDDWLHAGNDKSSADVETK